MFRTNSFTDVSDLSGMFNCFFSAAVRELTVSGLDSSRLIANMRTTVPMKVKEAMMRLKKKDKGQIKFI